MLYKCIHKYTVSIVCMCVYFCSHLYGLTIELASISDR